MVLLLKILKQENLLFEICYFELFDCLESVTKTL